MTTEEDLPKRRGSKDRIKSWLMRPATFRLAVLVLRLIRLVAEVIDLVL